MEKPDRVYIGYESQGKIRFRWRRKGRAVKEGYLYVHWVRLETSLVLRRGYLLIGLDRELEFLNVKFLIL